MNYFISAIGTDSGKTLFSAIIVEALKADYWKPIQAGTPTDTDTVEKLVSNSVSKFHNEAYLLKTPASPHAAAKVESISLQTSNFKIPVSENTIIIEGAGGLMVPINDHEFVADLPRIWQMPVILVVNLYLGSINHTLLSVEYLKQKKIKVKGIVFNGKSNPDSERIILQQSGYDLLLRIPELKIVNREVVRDLADEFLKNWNE